MKLTHPDAPGVSIDPTTEHADAYLSQGWVAEAETPVADDKPKK